MPIKRRNVVITINAIMDDEMTDSVVEVVLVRTMNDLFNAGEVAVGIEREPDWNDDKG